MRSTAYEGYSVREIRMRCLALKLTIWERERAKVGTPARLGSAVVELAGGLLRPGYHHSAARHRSRLRFLSRRIGTLVVLAQAVAAQQEDLGVLHQPVGNGGRDGRIEEDVAPVGERCIGGDNRRTFLAVTRGDHLIEEIGSLLVQSQVS